MTRLLSGVLIASTLALPAHGETLSRAEAVARALEVNPTVQKSREDLLALNGQKDQALADALPELTLVGLASRYRDPSLLNSSSFDAFPPELRESLKPIPTNLFEGAVTVRQTLFSFKIGKAIRAARLARALGDEEVRRARQAVALEAAQVYNDYLLALEQVRVAEKVMNHKERQLEMAQNRRQAGVATELDVLRTRVDLENQRAQVLRLRGVADLSRARLNAVMVRPIDTPIEPVDTLAFQPLDIALEDAVREAWETRPESKAIALNEKIHTELVGVARAEAQPSLDASGSYGYSVRRPNDFFEPDFSRWTAGVTLTVPVFDGFRTRGKVAQATAERNKVTQDRIALENEIRLEARDSLDRLRVARSVLEAAELNVTQALKALEMTEANYRHGAATLLDVLDAQTAATEAESNRVLALYTHANARATLRFVMGRDPLDTAPAAPTTGS